MSKAFKVIFQYRDPKCSQRFYSPACDWQRDKIVENLTIGKTYIANEINNGSRYLVLNDKNFIDDYPINVFTKLEDIRNDKINEILK